MAIDEFAENILPLIMIDTTLQTAVNYSRVRMTFPKDSDARSEIISELSDLVAELNNHTHSWFFRGYAPVDADKMQVI